MLVAVLLPIVAHAIESALSDRGHQVVVSDSGDGQQVIDLARSLDPAVVVIEEGLTGIGGLGACARLATGSNPRRVLMVSRASDPELLTRAVEAGAMGYAAMDQASTEIVAACETVLKGHASIPEHMLGDLLRDLGERRRTELASQARLALLTRREREVLGLMTEGLGSPEISTKLFLSRHTVRTHIQNLIRKLGVHSRSEAVILAMQTRTPHSRGEPSI